MGRHGSVTSHLFWLIGTSSSKNGLTAHHHTWQFENISRDGNTIISRDGITIISRDCFKIISWDGIWITYLAIEAFRKPFSQSARYLCGTVLSPLSSRNQNVFLSVFTRVMMSLKYWSIVQSNLYVTSYIIWCIHRTSWLGQEHPIANVDQLE